MAIRGKRSSKIKATGCPVGRPLDPGHPTCKSCPVDCSGSKRGGTEVITAWVEGKALKTRCYLYSPNHWHGRPLHVYLSQKRKWRKVLDGTWALWGKQSTMRRQITVTRQVRSEDALISDPDNLRFCLKPILDCLKGQAVIKDDSRTYIEEPTITQVVGALQIVTIEVADTDSAIQDAA